MSHLKEIYQKEIVPKLMKELGYNNVNAVPRISKVVLNMGVGKAVDDKSELEKAIADLTLIAGQKVVSTTAKKSISAFKIRTGYKIGAKVTLRGNRMYEFLDKLFNIVLPQTRDFRGLQTTGLDGSGNFSIGFSEQTVFPEIDPNKIAKLRGLQVVIVTTAKTNKEGEVLLRFLGCPLSKKG